MPGSNDQLANMPSGVDQVSPRESDPVSRRGPDPVIAELRERMERLPPGHPSSPYNDDGSRKPPPPDLSAYELPIPGDPDYQPEPLSASKGDHPTDEAPEGVDDRQHVDDKGAADEAPTPDSEAARPSDSEDKPRSGPDGLREWQGYPLTAEQSGAADRRVERCQEAEGRDMDDGYGEEGITPAMRRIEAKLNHGELVPDTEKFTLKTADRFKEKLARMILEEPDADWHELIPRIADGIRYTFSFPDGEYTSGVTEVRESLTSAGFEFYEQKNAWADETKSYKGINSTWMDPDSELLFEVQMHTTASWNAKQESHHEYEIIESRTATAEEKKQAGQRQDQIFASVPIPDGALQILTYRKEGW
jgi:hypothetical protein